jgi:hypothetical protein
LESIAKLLLAWFGNPIRALATLMIAAVIILALRPIKWFADTMQDHLWRWPLIVLVTSFAGLATYPTEIVWKHFRRAPNARKRKEQLTFRLKGLTRGEKEVLREFIVNKSRTRDFRATDGDVPSLTKEGMLEMITVAALGIAGFRIAEEVWQYLLENPKTLDD